MVLTVPGLRGTHSTSLGGIAQLAGADPAAFHERGNKHTPKPSSLRTRDNKFLIYTHSGWYRESPVRQAVVAPVVPPVL